MESYPPSEWHGQVRFWTLVSRNPKIGLRCMPEQSRVVTACNEIMKSCQFLMKFQLRGLKLLDLGIKIITIGPEITIIQKFMALIQKPLVSTEFCNLFILEMNALTLFGKFNCGIVLVLISRLKTLITPYICTTSPGYSLQQHFSTLSVRDDNHAQQRHSLPLCTIRQSKNT